jgi:hypothetical protein
MLERGDGVSILVEAVEPHLRECGQNGGSMTEEALH